jgi:hypothetical protein
MRPKNATNKTPPKLPKIREPQKRLCFAGPFDIAGAGFEPATFGL